MNVSEVISELKKHPPDANVYINDNEYGLNKLKSIIVIDASRHFSFNLPNNSIQKNDVALQWWEAHE